MADTVSGDTVDLAAGTYQPASGTSFNISTSITIEPTAPGSTVVLKGNGNTVLVVENSSATPGPTVAISGVVIEGGASEFYGGGIAEYSGALFVEDSTISGNIAGITGPPSTTGYGGGIWSQDGTSLTVEDSTISGNSATADGGGILTGDGTLTVEDSTISGNTSGAGGGIAMFLDSAATVEDSTISGNNSGGSFASGIYVEGPVTLAADIIAKQAIGPECQEVMGGTQIMDAGYNVDDDGTCGFSSANHSVSDSPVIDDYLGTLASNGGPTETVPLLAIPSPTTAAPDPAFEAIPSTFDLPVAENGVSLACSVPDQRGFARNASCDMGAFETSIDTVTFNSEGGSAVGSLSGLDGTTITLPAAPTRAGYSFNGWFTASSGGSALTSPYTVIGSVTLYAQWTANATDRYSYAAGAGSGTAPASGSGLDGTTITLAANTFSDPGYTFAGWSDGTKAYAAGAAYLLSSGGGSITFTAQWTPNSTDILTFDSGGGSAVGSLSGLDGTTITLPAAPTASRLQLRRLVQRAERRFGADLALHAHRLVHPLRPVDCRADHEHSHPFAGGDAVRIDLPRCLRVERHERQVPAPRRDLRPWRLGGLHGHADRLRMDVRLEHHHGPQRRVHLGFRGLRPRWKYLQFWRQHHCQEPATDHERAHPFDGGDAVRIDLPRCLRLERHERQVPALRRHLRLFSPGGVHSYRDRLRMAM